MQRIRAGKAADAAAEAAAAEEAEQAEQQQPPQQQQPQPRTPTQQQQPQQRYAHVSEDELAAAVGEPSEWDMSWVSSDYTQHPKVCVSSGPTRLQRLTYASAAAGLTWLQPSSRADTSAGQPPCISS